MPRSSRVLTTAFTLLALAPVAHAAISQDVEELQKSEREQESRLKALGKRREVLSKDLKKKSRAYHALSNNTAAVGFLWEESGGANARHVKLDRLLQVKIREELKELENLDMQESDLRAELDWVRVRIKESASAEAPVDTSATDTGTVRCEDTPVRLAPGASFELLQDFGPRRDAETGIEWKSMGWWLGRVGPDVRACASGTVVFAGKVPGRGRVVIVDHGKGLVTLYANLNEDPGSVRVEKGERVGAGAVLGLPKDRVYFEARRNGAAVNPREVLPQKIGL